MEFKDKLKQKRIERNITQAELAKTIFVSRSAVAKWENGRGLPNSDSKKALATYFGVSEDYFEPDKLDEETVAKEQKKEKIINLVAYTIITITIAIFLCTGLYYLGFRINSRHLAFSQDDYLLQTKDYDFYFNIPDNDDGTMYCMIVIPVKRYGFVYYEKSDVDHLLRMEKEDGTLIGHIKVYEGSSCTYNIYYSDTEQGPGFTKHLYLDDTMIVNGKEIDLYRQSYFVMTEDIETVEFLGMKIRLTKIK